MEPSSCTICGVANSRLCGTCRSAAYCSLECQQADHRVHKLLCRQFKEGSASNFAVRPSPTHYLAIYLPVKGPLPILTWVNSKESSPGYFYPKLDSHLGGPEDKPWVSHDVFVRGNSLRGRKHNQNTLNIFTIEAGPEDQVNETIHGTPPTLIGDLWGDFVWKGPIVAVMKVGSESDPRLLMDITLTGYRDALDYLGYYRDGIGSMIDGIGASDLFSKRTMAERSGKVQGVRINCLGDQARGRAEMEAVTVPKMHPLVNLEGDDPCCIPDRLQRAWVAKRYGGKLKSGADAMQSDLQNPVARMLLLQTSLKFGKWEGLYPRWKDPFIGSLLFVDRRGGDLKIHEVRNMYGFIQQEVYPLMTDGNANEKGVQEVLDVITEKNFKALLDG